MALFSGRFVVPAPGCSCGISLNLGCRQVGVRAGRPRTIFGRAPGSRQEWTDRVRTRPASAARSRPVPRGRRPARPPALAAGVTAALQEVLESDSVSGSSPFPFFPKLWATLDSRIATGPGAPRAQAAGVAIGIALGPRTSAGRIPASQIPSCARCRGPRPPPHAPVPPGHPRGGLARILSDLAPSALILMLI